ncbi:restriction endonuclease subunit S [Nesterenkonia alkaliphila]|uniref:Type I restriction modification DNA specificity domain-containing protein n=1 Tax=Nesterenkonia alkaliphila TaxID=1463631 RepID=A0A7K1UET9_9MICC|nr:restriction endonuclease subunit S [Nesterenkonia alkaliphila]MVT24990.1 hypothetical protein [Nesterenkonia alkaliphila]
MPIGEIGEVFDGPHATPKSTKTATSGPVFLGISSIENGRLDLAKSAHLSEEDFAQWTRRVTPRARDVVFSYETRIGEAAIVPAGLRCCLGRRLALIRPNTQLVDPQFLLFAYLGPEFQEEIRQRTVHGSTVDRIMLKEFPEFPLRLPPLEEQRGIAATLGALDDKIDSNRRLQHLSQELLRATVNAELQASFPDDMKLGDLCFLVKDKVAPEQMSAEDAYIGLEHMPRGSIALDSWDSAEDVGSQKAAFEQNDVLFGKLRPYFRKVGIAPLDGVCSTDILVLRPYETIDLALVATVASSQELIDSVSASATGTRMPRASWKDLSEWPVPALTLGQREGLSERCNPLIERMNQLTDENQKLAALRDALLPELLSGRIRVPEAAEVVSSA